MVCFAQFHFRARRVSARQPNEFSGQPEVVSMLDEGGKTLVHLRYWLV